MPELPEVETIRRQLSTQLIDRTITEGWGDKNPKFSSAPLATGSKIEDVSRRGKYLLVSLDSDRELIIHLGMTGRLAVTDEIPTAKHLRAWWSLDSGEFFSLTDVRQFGRISVVKTGQYASLATLDSLGPEPLSDEFDGEHLWRATKSRSARIKTQLLSQRPVAGVGNIYADEALWIAGIYPADRKLSRARADALASAIKETLASAINFGGTTLRDYVDATGNQGSNQYQLFCYGRAGEQCVRCGDVLVSKQFDARTTTWCPTCQPRRR